MTDFAILEIREYRGEKDVLSRRMTAPRGGMQLLDGHVLATRFDFETPKRKTVTRVTFKDLRAQRIDHRLFTVNALERKAELKRAMAAKDGS